MYQRGPLWAAITSLAALGGCASAPITADVAQAISPTTLEGLPTGSKVKLISLSTPTSTTETTGIVLQSSSAGVALMNAVVYSHEQTGMPVLSRVPYASRMFKNTGVGVFAVPVLWVSAEVIAEATVTAPPDPDQPLPSLALNSKPYQSEHDGQHERIGIDF
jgi:hypothetical protein